MIKIFICWFWGHKFYTETTSSDNENVYIKRHYHPNCPRCGKSLIKNA